MRQPNIRRLVALLGTLLLLATACSGAEEADQSTSAGAGPTEADAASLPSAEDSEESELSDAQAETEGDASSPAEITFDEGITEEPCPAAVNPDNGCIYLGQLSDLTEGPFAPVGPQFVEATNLFWNRVNEEGGIGGRFDVDTQTYVRDNLYNPQTQVERFREIEPDVFAIAQSLGTPTTLAVRDQLDELDMLAVPSTLWSGWIVDDIMLQSGYGYCAEAVNGLDWAAAEDGDPQTVMAVHFPGYYGGDSAAGVAMWAEANNIEFDPAVHSIETLPNAAAGNQDAPIEAILREDPDVVVVATGAREMAEIVGQTVAQGFGGRFMGAIPSYNPAMLESDAGQAILDNYRLVTFYEPFGTSTPGHDALAEALDGETPTSDFFILGWIWQYPLLSALEAGAENGDLTRSGVRSIIPDLEVDYEGMLPTYDYSQAFTQAVINEPDVEGAVGTSALTEFVEGRTAAELDFSQPGISAG